MQKSKELIVCGGGAFNLHLLERLQAALPYARQHPSARFGALRSRGRRLRLAGLSNAQAPASNLFRRGPSSRGAVLERCIQPRFHLLVEGNFLADKAAFGGFCKKNSVNCLFME
jgi:anhydro-N-acetylmuramic acid kinase